MILEGWYLSREYSPRILRYVNFPNAHNSGRIDKNFLVLFFDVIRSPKVPDRQLLAQRRADENLATIQWLSCLVQTAGIVKDKSAQLLVRGSWYNSHELTRLSWSRQG